MERIIFNIHGDKVFNVFQFYGRINYFSFKNIMEFGDTNVLDPVGNKKVFFSHVFSTTEEGKAEILNILQYSLLGVVPIVILNKCLQRFIPDADSEKSSLEIFAEVLIQLVFMFVGIVIIHRIITYIPTYSEFKYESLTLTNVVLAFLLLILSIQTKLGIKVNILTDRVMDMWNGGRENMENQTPPKKMRNATGGHQAGSSRGDFLDTTQSGVFPPTPISTNKPDSGNDTLRGNPFNNNMGMMDNEPMAANSFGGGSFGGLF